MFTRTHLVLAALLAIVVFLTGAISTDHSQPNVEFLPEMKRSPASSAYSSSLVFPNGRTLQVPVAGTIARGDLPLYYAATKEDAARAGEELRNPYAIETDGETAGPPPGAVDGEPPSEQRTEQPTGRPTKKTVEQTTGAASATQRAAESPPPTAQELQAQREAQARERLQASVQRGEAIYQINCISCHGPKGAGDGPVAKRGFPPPPPLTTGKSAQMKDGQLFHILTYGQGSMASMAAQLSRPRRWDAINYVRSMQQSAAASLPQVAAGSVPPTESAAEPDTKPDTRSGAQPETKSDAEPDAKGEGEGDIKSDAEPDIQPDTTDTPSGTEEGTP